MISTGRAFFSSGRAIVTEASFGGTENMVKVYINGPPVTYIKVDSEKIACRARARWSMRPPIIIIKDGGGIIRSMVMVFSGLSTGTRMRESIATTSSTAKVSSLILLGTSWKKVTTGTGSKGDGTVSGCTPINSRTPSKVTRASGVIT